MGPGAEVLRPLPAAPGGRVSSADFPDFRRATWWDRLVRVVKVGERRRKNRRRRPWQCQRCPANNSLAIIGRTDVGAQITKCRVCQNMDRRLPGDRREAGWYRRADEIQGIAWGRIAAMLLASLAAALTVVRTW